MNLPLKSIKKYGDIYKVINIKVFRHVIYKKFKLSQNILNFKTLQFII